MNSKERMRCVMHGKRPDRVPVMCQLSLGHMYKNTHLDPVDFWFTTEGSAQALIQMADAYRFDGILVSKPGLDPSIRQQVERVERKENGHIITWKNGVRTFVPTDEYPHDLGVSQGHKQTMSVDEIKLDSICTIQSANELPAHYYDLLDLVIAQRGGSHSIHGEVATAFERFLLLFGSYEAGLMALLDDREKCLAIMERLNAEVIIHSRARCTRSIDALKLSSPLAGSGFVSRGMYEEFVLPFEKEVIRTIHSESNIPCYLHTCGAIGDRLDLMMDTGIDGIECLDPPPLGNVELETAVDEIGHRVFIKGNLDSVNELVLPPAQLMEVLQKRIETGTRCAKGYILSSACSISPKVPPENVKLLYEAASRFGNGTS